MALSITYGEGLQRPQGKRVALPEGHPIDTLVDALRGLPRKTEAWWSPSTWRDNYRLAKQWEAASGVAVDVDYEIKDASPPLNLVEQLVIAARAGRLPGSAFHLTPHGCRLFFGFAENCTDAELYVRASFGAGALAAQALADATIFDYRVDEAILKDLGRLFFAPCAFAKGVQRDAEVLRLRAEPFTPAELAAHAPAPVEQPKTTPATPPRRDVPVSELIARWNADHIVDWPRAGGDCPACGHKGCFGRLPDDDTRWFCFSTNHTAPGVQSGNGFHGDAIDLEAHARGCKPLDVLRTDGYLSAPSAPRPAAPPSTPAAITPLDAVRRPLRNGSYLTAVTIIESNARDVLRGRVLELNAMTGRPELGRAPIRDEDVYAVRAEIERRFSGGVDRAGNEVGLKVSQADVFAAVSQVAAMQPYHPVREYLEGLTWDRKPRLEHVPEDILDAVRSPLNAAIVRCFMVSAVARALEPGCKVDTVPILVGRQGCGKSSFVRILAGAWFVDSNVDIYDKDSFQILRRAWLYEWGELAVLRRARDLEAVKGFVTSQVDTYRPSYGRFVIDVPRGCVIVGTTNDDEFLSDPSGHRRWWPIRCGQVDLDALVEQRDQLWAEALELYRSGSQAPPRPWEMTNDERAQLGTVHEEYAVTDAWDGPVLFWVEKRLSVEEFTTSDVIEHALGKPRGQWNRGDEMRVAGVLKRHGWKLGNKPKGRAKPWIR